MSLDPNSKHRYIKFNPEWFETESDSTPEKELA
jgi:hypothetical protein